MCVAYAYAKQCTGVLDSLKPCLGLRVRIIYTSADHYQLKLGVAKIVHHGRNKDA